MEFDKPTHNMEEFLDKVNDSSIDWDNFNSHRDSEHDSINKSDNDFFKSGNHPERPPSFPSFEESRSIGEISYIDAFKSNPFGTMSNSSGFQYAKPVSLETHKPDPRFARLT